MKKQEVTVKEEQAITLAPELMGSWDNEAVEAKDIRIPRGLMMQAMSDLVGERKAVAGQVINSITHEVLGTEEKPVDIIPIYTFKTWTIQHKVNGKFEYLKAEPYTAANSTRPREEKILDVDYQNVETINLLGMLEADLAKADALPYLFTFRMTSYACGKDILTLKENCRRTNRPMAAYVIKLVPTYTKNDKGQFYVMKYGVPKANASFEKHALTLKTWHQTFAAGSVKVDEEVAEAPAESTVKDTRF